MAGSYGTTIDADDPLFGSTDDESTILGQWIEACLTTARGKLWSAPDHGDDLRAFVGRGFTTDDLARLPSAIKSAIETDERIARADVTPTTRDLGGGSAALSFSIAVYTQNGSTFLYTATLSPGLVSVILQGAP